jgi:hypothetical protein
MHFYRVSFYFLPPFLQNIILSTLFSKTPSAYVRTRTWQTGGFYAPTVSYYDLFWNVSTVFFAWWPWWLRVVRDSYIRMVRSTSLSREISLESFSNDFRNLLQENQFYPWGRPHTLITTTWFRVFNYKCSWFPWTFVTAQVYDTQQCLGNSMCLWPEQMIFIFILMQFSQK